MHSVIFESLSERWLDRLPDIVNCTSIRKTYWNWYISKSYLSSSWRYLVPCQCYLFKERGVNTRRSSYFRIQIVLQMPRIIFVYSHCQKNMYANLVTNTSMIIILLVDFVALYRFIFSFQFFGVIWYLNFDHFCQSSENSLCDCENWVCFWQNFTCIFQISWQ